MEWVSVREYDESGNYVQTVLMPWENLSDEEKGEDDGGVITLKEEEE